MHNDTSFKEHIRMCSHANNPGSFMIGSIDLQPVNDSEATYWIRLITTDYVYVHVSEILLMGISTSHKVSNPLQESTSS